MAGTSTTLKRDATAGCAADGPVGATATDHVLLSHLDHHPQRQQPLGRPVLQHHSFLQQGHPTAALDGDHADERRPVMAHSWQEPPRDPYTTSSHRGYGSGDGYGAVGSDAFQSRRYGPLHSEQDYYYSTGHRPQPGGAYQAAAAAHPPPPRSYYPQHHAWESDRYQSSHQQQQQQNLFARDRYCMDPPPTSASRYDFDPAPVPPRYANHHHHALDRSYEYDYHYPSTDYSAPSSHAVQPPVVLAGDWSRALPSRDSAISPASAHSPVSWARYPDHLATHSSSSMFPLPPPPPVPVPPPPMSNSSGSSQYPSSTDRPRLPSLITSAPLGLTRPILPPPTLPRMDWPLARAASGHDRPSAGIRSPSLFDATRSANSALSSPGALLPEVLSPVAGAVAPAAPAKLKTAASKTPKSAAGQGKRQGKAQPAIEDEEEFDADDDKERISKNYFQFSVATYKLMVKYLERAGQQSSSAAGASASASDPISPDGPRTDGSANKRSNVLSDRYPTTQEIHDVDPTNALPRKRWKRLQENLQLWTNRPMFRNLSWKGCSLIIVPREHWRDLFLEHHVMRVPNPVTQAEIHRHLSARDTFHSLWKSYQTRRSRCGLTLVMIEAMVAECRCPMSSNALEEPEAGASRDDAEEAARQGQPRVSGDICASPLVQTRLPSPPPSANPDVLPVG